MSEAGMPGFTFDSWYGVWAPKGTPLPIRERVNGIMREAMANPEVVARLKNVLLEPVIETMDQTRAFIASEIPKHTALLESVGFKPE
jgi:tripartite-type tricarboxylate transporter receptor subunit TctC